MSNVLTKEAWTDALANLRLICRDILISNYIISPVAGDKQSKKDGSWVTQVDLLVQERVKVYLQKLLPEAGMLSEETSSVEQIAQLKNKNVFWIVDPLDGTNNFINRVPYFSTSIALVVGHKIIAGMVYSPIHDELFHAYIGNGSYLNYKKMELKKNITPTEITSAIAVIDFKRIHKKLRENLVAKMPYGSHRNWGSSSLEWCWLASNRCHMLCYSRQYIWDYAAGWLILHEAGGFSSTFAKKDVSNFDSLTQSVIATVNVELYQKWYDWINIYQ